MSVSFRIDIKWLNGSAFETPEFALTYAQLVVSVDEFVLTKVNDESASSVRDSIFVPLFPLVEWACANWWFITAEPPGLRRPEAREYLQRHSLRFAGGGYCWPDMLIEPLGEWVRLRWRPYHPEFADVGFIERSGVSHIRLDDLRAEFARVIDATLDRASEAEAADSIAHDWAATIESEGDPEQLAFCKAAASVGEDPLAMQEKDRNALVACWRNAQKIGLLDEVFFDLCATLDRFKAASLEGSIGWLAASIAETKANPALSWVRDIRQDVQADLAEAVSKYPWQIGYQVARRARAEVAKADEPVTTEHLCGTLQSYEQTSKSGGISAFCRSNGDGDLRVRIASGRPDSERFRAARAIFHGIAAAGPHIGLVTEAETDSQAASRAFAAELLAPSNAIKKRLRNVQTVRSEEIDVLAQEFQVSPWVIRHQIENHKLANIHWPLY